MRTIHVLDCDRLAGFAYALCTVNFNRYIKAGTIQHEIMHRPHKNLDIALCWIVPAFTYRLKFTMQIA